MGFLVNCVGITILQLSKGEFEGLDLKFTTLLQALRARAEHVGEDIEKGLATVEKPDVGKGKERSVGAELIAETSHGQSSADSVEATEHTPVDTPAGHFGGSKRQKSCNPPVYPPLSHDQSEPLGKIQSSSSKRSQAVKSQDRDLVHSSVRAGVHGERSAVYEYRDSNVPLSSVWLPSRPEDHPFAKRVQDTFLENIALVMTPQAAVSDAS